MAHRIDSRRSAAPPERSVRARGALGTSLETDVERPRRIDAYIDYFGSGEGRRGGGFFATHPATADRIQALRDRK